MTDDAYDALTVTYASHPGALIAVSCIAAYDILTADGIPPDQAASDVAHFAWRYYDDGQTRIPPAAFAREIVATRHAAKEPPSAG